MDIHFMAESHAAVLERTRKNFALSPLREVAWALHVLARPTDHGIFQRWILAARQRMGPSWTDQLEEHALIFQGWLQALIPIPSADDLTPHFDDEWERFMGLSVMDLESTYERIRNRWTEDFDKRMARNSEWIRVALLTKGSWWSPWRGNLEALRDQLGYFMREFWNREFQTVWEENYPYLEDDVKNLGSARGSPGLWWQNMSPRLRLERDLDTVKVHVPWKTTLLVKHNTIVRFFPSVFCWPHLWVDGDEHQVNITYQSLAVRNWAMPVPVPAQMETLLEAISEPTRLLIIRHLVGSMRTTSAISHALRLSAGTVSRHLTFLHSVGLVERIADGHYVFYRTSDKGLARLAADLQNLRRDPVPRYLGWHE
ncbi:transcriptional regulator, ArsR family [Sulfobacillus thermosulfidooxidans DSM 9293]|uniref:Transcriptional regulator, ArsR family n=1 Tax=Sulfobacillus thermosulfidooxidans (strain DSM 9293 / VKM B-1269 / AT-1) TaxID=929705 RepID=A0A1W1WCF0_SULTA|nr:DUF5937 family protein [Sulfobacillus thermosulfidooxidans]SMC03895.1 transcriptional regulator, ArsR family [Sulfobacillus thermosulfidooxidans DSM 9293]